LKAEEEARVKAEQAAKANAEEEARIKAEEEAKIKAEQQTKVKVKEEIRVKAEEAKAQEEARIKEEQEAIEKAEEEAEAKAQEEARVKAEDEAKIKAEHEAEVKAEQEVRVKAEQQANVEAEKESRMKAEQETEAKAEEEARIRVQNGAKLKAEQKAKSKVEEEACIKAEQEAIVRAEQEAKLKAEEEVRTKVEEEDRVKAEQEAKAKAEDQARTKMEEETRVKAEQEAKAKAEQETRTKVEEEARVNAEQEVNAKAEEEARIKAEDEVRVKAEQETRAKIEEEAHIKAEEEVKVKADEVARINVEKVAIVETKEEAKAKTDEEAKVKAEEQARAKAMTEEQVCIKREKARMKAEEELEPNGAEEIEHVGETRISELERLEREFGLINTVAVIDDKITKLNVAGIEYQPIESRKVDSSFHERGSGVLEKIKTKDDVIANQQTEITADLVELEGLKQNKLKRVEKSNIGEVEDLEQTSSEVSRFANYEESRVEDVVTSPGHELVDDEAKKLADAITKSDELYIPPKKVLASTSLLMKKLEGVSLENYSGKEGLFSERNIGVHAGNTLKVPVRVSVPGSIVEFSIVKKSYDFSFGINAFLDEGRVEKIKEMTPFRKRSDTQKILVPAESAPCTMQFLFTNNYSTLLEKVHLGYQIRVIPPSIETIQLGRRRRTKSSLKFLESEVLSQREILKTSAIRVAELDRDAIRLQNDINEKIARLDSIRAEEESLRKMLSRAREIPQLTNRINKNIYPNEF